MRNQKKSVTIIAMALAVLMVLSLFAGIFSSLMAQGRTLADIDREINTARGQLNDLQSQAGAIEAQMGTLSGQITALRAEEGVYLEELALLQEQLELLREHIDLTQMQIDIYTQMIADKEVRLEEAIQRETEQFELYIRRVRAMEERGSLSYLQILLTARSFSDLITQIHDASAIMEADERIADALERYRLAVEEYRNELIADQLTLEALIEQLEAEQAILEAESAEVEARIAEIEARIEAREIEMAALYAEQERMQEEILQRARTLTTLDSARQEAIRELERQAAQGGGGMGGSPARPGTGQFIWPSDFTRNVTSGFGPRQSPGGIGSRNHRGIDIAAAGINGTNVLAAASGVVVFSGWNGGFGNVVQINHGNGYHTLYAHNSSNVVSVGQNVVQGQVIARVGTTGASTGPHIHFEIIRNGVHVNPMLYFQ